jgi:hypothetical protein
MWGVLGGLLETARKAGSPGSWNAGTPMGSKTGNNELLINFRFLSCNLFGRIDRVKLEDRKPGMLRKNSQH